MSCPIHLKKGINKGNICNKPIIKNSNFCSYHYKKLKYKMEEKEEKEEIYKKRCEVCNNLLGELSKISMTCGHKFHIKCFMIFSEDEYGYIYKPYLCPLCKYNCKNELEETCSICLDNCIDDIYKLPCNHIFHKSCIKDWDGSKGCPNCRIIY